MTSSQILKSVPRQDVMRGLGQEHTAARTDGQGIPIIESFCFVFLFFILFLVLLLF